MMLPISRISFTQWSDVIHQREFSSVLFISYNKIKNISLSNNSSVFVDTRILWTDIK